MVASSTLVAYSSGASPTLETASTLVASSFALEASSKAPAAILLVGLISVVSSFIKVETPWVQLAGFPLVSSMDLADVSGVLVTLFGILLSVLLFPFLFGVFLIEFLPFCKPSSPQWP